MSNEACHHFIPLTKDCPWCKRKGVKGFPLREPFHLYQCHMAEFIKQVANDNCQGPLNIVIVAQDMNGEKYMYAAGTNFDALLTYADERLSDKC